MRMHINASHHGALGVVLVEVTVINDIPKCYSREFSVTNDILKALHHVRARWPRYGPGISVSHNVLNKEDGFYMFLGLLVFRDVGIWVTYVMIVACYHPLHACCTLTLFLHFLALQSLHPLTF